MSNVSYSKRTSTGCIYEANKPKRISDAHSEAPVHPEVHWDEYVVEGEEINSLCPTSDSLVSIRFYFRIEKGTKGVDLSRALLLFTPLHHEIEIEVYYLQCCATYLDNQLPITDYNQGPQFSTGIFWKYRALFSEFHGSLWKHG